MHEAGGQVYLDGANMNAQVPVVGINLQQMSLCTLYTAVGSDFAVML